MSLPKTLELESFVTRRVDDEKGDGESKECKVDSVKRQNDESDGEKMTMKDKDVDNDGSKRKTLTTTESAATMEAEASAESSLIKIEDVPIDVPDETKRDETSQCDDTDLSSQSINDCTNGSNQAPMQMSGAVFHLVLLPSADIYQPESPSPDSTQQKTSAESESAVAVQTGRSAEPPFLMMEGAATRAQDQNKQGVEELRRDSLQPVSNFPNPPMLNQATLQIHFIPMPAPNVFPTESHRPEPATKAITDSFAGAALGMCNSSPSVGPPIIEPSIRVAQLPTYSSTDVTQFPHGSSDNKTHSSTVVVQPVANSSGITKRSTPGASREEPRSVQSSLPDSTKKPEQYERKSSKTFARPVQTDQKIKSSASNSLPKLRSSVVAKLGNPDSAEVLPSSRALTKLLQNPSISIIEKPRDVETPKTQQRNNLRSNSASKAERDNSANQTDETKYVRSRRKQILQKLLDDGAIESGQTIPEIYHVPWNKETLQKNQSSAGSDKDAIPISQCTTVEPFCIVGDTTLVVKKAVTETKLERLKSIQVKKLINEPGSSGRRAETLDFTDGRIMDGCFEEDVRSRESAASKSTIPASRRKTVELGERANQRQSDLSTPRTMQAHRAKSPADLDRAMRNKWRAECAICKERFVDNCELHRHVTLSHPGVRIVFCELCSSSFRTDNELEQHRLSNHKKPETKNEESNSAKFQSKTATNSKILPHRPKKSTSSFNDCRLISRDNSMTDREASFDDAYNAYLNQNFRARMAKKKVANSTVRTRNFGKLSQSGSSSSSVTRGLSRTRGTTQKSVYHYVDVDVMKHKAIARQSKFQSAEIRKLVVELARLDESALEKYLIKSDTDSMSGFILKSLSKRRGSINSSSSTKIGDDSRSDNGRTKRTRGLRKNVEIVDESKAENREPTDDSVLARPRRSTRFRNTKKGIYNDFTETSDDESTRTLSPNGDEKSMRSGESINRRKTRGGERINLDKEVSSSERSTTIEPGKAKKVSETVKKERIESNRVSTSSVTSSSTIDSNTSGPSSENPSSKEDRELSTKTLRGRKKRTVTDKKRSRKSPYSLRKSSAGKRTLKSSNTEKLTGDKRESNDAKDESNGKSVDENERSAENIDEGNRLEEEKSEDGKQTKGSFDDTEKQTSPKANDEKQRSNDIESDRKAKDSVSSRKHKLDDKEENKGEKSDDHVENRSKEKNLDETEDGAEKTRLKDKSNDNSEVSKNASNDVTRPQQENNGKLGNLGKTDDSRSKEVSNEQCDTTLPKAHTSDKVHIKIVKQKCQRAINDVTKPDDLCLVCEELFVLMQEVSREVDKRKTSGEPIKCPFCKRYFISMFHLELHVAKNHLCCQKKVPCKRSRSSKDDKLPRNTELDCKIEVATAIEIPKCATELESREEDARERAIIRDESALPKETPFREDPRERAIIRDESALPKETSSREDPRERAIIRDESALPKETTSHAPPERIKATVVPSKNAEISNSRVSSNHTLNNSIPKVRTSVTPRSSTFDCSRCGAKFSKTTEYVRHVRETHSASQTSSLAKRKSRSKKSANKDCLLYKEDSFHEISSTNVDEEVPKPPKPKSTARPTGDGEDLFKQHLLNVAREEKEREVVVVKRKRGRPRKIKEEDIEDQTLNNIIEEPEDDKVVGFLSNQHTCKICQKKFRRAQDLLIHGMEHTDNDASEGNNENLELSDDEDSDCDQEPVIDSVFDGANIIQHSASTNEAADDVDYFNDCASENVEFDSENQGAPPSNVSPEVEDTTIDSKKRKIPTAGSVDLSEDRFGDAMKDSMEELIETQIGAGVDKNDKLPIACNKCNRHFANQSLLNEHLFFLHDDSLKDTVLTDVLTPRGDSKRSNHSDTPQSWHCETCLQNFKLFQAYSRHRYFAHGDDSMVHVCENCSKVLTNVTMVNVHICTNMTTYNCRPCDMTFSTGMSLRLHNTEKHMETNGQHLCERCDRKFLTNSMLQRHEAANNCFAAPHRARNSSPVRMATPDTTNNEESEKPASPMVADDVNEKSEERDSGCDQNADREMDSLLSIETPQSRLGSRRSCRDKKNAMNKKSRKRKGVSANEVPVKRKRGRPRKYQLSEEEESSYDTSDDELEEEIEDSSVSAETVLHIDETEIHQCSFCQLYCLSITTLRNHMAQIHSVTDQICQVCYKMFPAGKLIRHLMEHHITSEDGYAPRSKTSWKFGINSNELDTEMFIKMLGMPRLVSLCEYRRHAGKTDLKSYPCLYCEKKSTTNELYGYHLLLHHDTMCALCNIEFKRGEDAARHKGEVHGSVGGYIWFADRTVMALTATKNFTDVTDSIFMRTLASDAKHDNSVAEENPEDSPEEGARNVDLVTESTSDGTKDGGREKIIATITSGEELVGTIRMEVEGKRVEDNRSSTRIETADTAEARKNAEETILAEATTVAEDPETPDDVAPKSDENADSSISQIPSVSSGDKIAEDEDCAQPEDGEFMIVVTDEDLQSFNIGHKHPNIWGLAAKISSTCDTITPTQVKHILQRYFERQEDLDA